MARIRAHAVGHIRHGKRAAIIAAVAISPMVSAVSPAAADRLGQQTATRTLDYYIDTGCISTDLNGVLWILRNNQLPAWYISAATMAINEFRADPFNPAAFTAFAGIAGAPWARTILYDCSRD